MPYPAACFTRHIDACNNAQMPGSRLPLLLDGNTVGWVPPEHAPPAALPDRHAFDAYVAQLRATRAYRSRNELFDVRADLDGPVLATVDRGAIPLLGIAACGMHLNGLVRRADGLHLWVGRRAADKRLDPNKFDHLAAGGIPAGHDAWSTLIKEGAEEADLPEPLARHAVPAGSLRYAMQRGEGLRRDRLFCFDLYLPETFTPHPADGEMAGFALWPLDQVMHRVAETNDFKFNVNLVLIDLFLRTILLDPHAEPGRTVQAAMQTLRAPA